MGIITENQKKHYSELFFKYLKSSDFKIIGEKSNFSTEYIRKIANLERSNDDLFKQIIRYLNKKLRKLELEVSNDLSSIKN